MRTLVPSVAPPEEETRGLDPAGAFSGTFEHGEGEEKDPATQRPRRFREWVAIFGRLAGRSRGTRPAGGGVSCWTVTV